jgi:hypothetical protein
MVEKTYQVTITVEVKSRDKEEALNDAVQYINALQEDGSLDAEIELLSKIQKLGG